MICWKVKKLIASGRKMSSSGVCSRSTPSMQEVGVFEPAEQRQVCGDAGDQPAPRRALPAGCGQTQDTLAEPVIDQDRPGQQQDEFRVPPAVEEQAGRDQPAQCPARPSDASSQEEPGQRQRQEAQDEFW